MRIVEFEPSHAQAFQALNEAWISRHFVLEPKDRAVLEDPKGRIVDRGGRIFMALEEDRPIGCVALIPMADGGYEVAKLAVDEARQGHGVGRRLMERCIEAGQADGARRLYLESSSKLAAARALYLATGFSDLPPVPSDYLRADVFMERPLP